jgi:PhnB protein
MIAPILAVKDCDASVAFYTEKLGFEKIFVLEGPDGSNTFGFVGLGEQAQIGLSAQPAPEPVGGGVVFMIYPPMEVNLDQLYEDVQSRGVSIEQPLRDEYWGDRTFSVKDPDGYYLTFTATVTNEPMEDIADIMKQYTIQ